MPQQANRVQSKGPNAKKRVLVVGGGGREHALSRALAESDAVQRVWVAPGNAGTAGCAENLPVAVGETERLVQAALEHEVDLVVVGPEAPLAAGLVDRLQQAGVLAFGPTRAAAQLETSKVFAKRFMHLHQLPTAAWRSFDDPAEAEAWLRARGEAMVVKADGLAAGKGVVVAETVEQSVAAVHRLMVEGAHGDAGSRVVLEERLGGAEVSFHAVCDGDRAVALPMAQDHKRLLDGDAGPNTGGMGAYLPPPFADAALRERVLREIVEPTLAGMRDRGAPFRGVLFLGLMVERGVPKLLEFNVRFGDPETQVLLHSLRGDVFGLLEGAARGALPASAVETEAAALGVVMASAGYPGVTAAPSVIEGVAEAEAMEGVRVYHAGTRVAGVLPGGEALLAAGGRVLTVSAVGQGVDQAAARAYAGVEAIAFEGAQWRTDIGWQARK